MVNSSEEKDKLLKSLGWDKKDYELLVLQIRRIKLIKDKSKIQIFARNNKILMSLLEYIKKHERNLSNLVIGFNASECDIILDERIDLIEIKEAIDEDLKKVDEERILVGSKKKNNIRIIEDDMKRYQRRINSYKSKIDYLKYPWQKRERQDLERKLKYMQDRYESAKDLKEAKEKENNAIDEKNRMLEVKRKELEKMLAELEKLQKEKPVYSSIGKNENTKNTKRTIDKKVIKGKNYVCSDIHGMYGSYMKAVSKLNENDRLYVLGDAIDRGNNGIEILLDIMSRKNVRFILGNHEWQMIRVLELMRKHNISVSELNEYCEAGRWARFELEELEEMKQPKRELESEQDYKKRKDELKKNVEMFRKNKNDILSKLKSDKLTDYEMQLIYIWIQANGGAVTMNKYLSLPKKQQDDIYNFLVNSVVIGKVQINNKKICIVHASPPISQEFLDGFEQKDEDRCIRYSNLAQMDERYMKSCLRICTETRDCDDGFLFWKKYGYMTIYGHTPQMGQITLNKNANSICIDTACSMNGKLALYCIEDDEVEYIEPIEDIRKNSEQWNR